MSKLLIAVVPSLARLRDRPLPGRSPALDVPLERRVEYALDCLDAESKQADQARSFLQRVRDRLDDSHLQSRVDAALNSPTE